VGLDCTAKGQPVPQSEQAAGDAIRRASSCGDSEATEGASEDDSERDSDSAIDQWSQSSMVVLEEAEN